MRFRLLPLILCMLCCVHGRSQPGEGGDYSNLKFGEVYDYYKKNEINIVSADQPDLYFEVFSWLGTDYCWGGKTRKGIDCSGFAAHLYDAIYHKQLSGGAGDIFKRCEIVPVSEMAEGDFVFFNIGKKHLSHVGVYLQNRRFAHATTHGGVMVSSLDEPYYKRYFYKAGRLKDTE